MIDYHACCFLPGGLSTEWDVVATFDNAVTHLHHKYAYSLNHLLTLLDVLDDCGNWRRNWGCSGAFGAEERDLGGERRCVRLWGGSD